MGNLKLKVVSESAFDGSKAAKRETNLTKSVSGRSDWLSVEERIRVGHDERDVLPRQSHGEFIADANRPDPISLLEGDGTDRLTELLPIRYGRMLASPFSLFRGSAGIMAWDLSRLPRTNLIAQLCGDAHVSNFGFFGSAERQLIIDINDFDETLPGPFEWDVKRLATSAILAAQERGFSSDTARDMALASVRAYRERMAAFAQMSTLEVWYSIVTAESVIALMSSRQHKEIAAHRMKKARARDNQLALSKFTEVKGDELRIKENPPLLVRLPEAEVAEIIQPIFRKYLQSLHGAQRQLLERYKYVDAGLRVGGVGSVGTRCYIVVLIGRDTSDPLVLQLKESGKSVLEPYLPKSIYRNEAQRIVTGQRLIQGFADLFLGWMRNSNGREFYFRQLYDMKFSAAIAEMNTATFNQYASVCGHLLARAHAKSGDPIAISAYLGKNERFDTAIANFAERYADQVERDFEALEQAAKQGRVPVTRGL